jgi:hypothetical protein
MQLGIAHQRILPSHPEQNGAHERMHRTLKAQTTRLPAAYRRAQQRSFDRFRSEYNDDATTAMSPKMRTTIES